MKHRPMIHRKIYSIIFHPFRLIGKKVHCIKYFYFLYIAVWNDKANKAFSSSCFDMNSSLFYFYSDNIVQLFKFFAFWVSWVVNALPIFFHVHCDAHDSVYIVSSSHRKPFIARWFICEDILFFCALFKFKVFAILRISMPWLFVVYKKHLSYLIFIFGWMFNRQSYHVFHFYI